MLIVKRDSCLVRFGPCAFRALFVSGVVEETKHLLALTPSARNVTKARPHV